MKNFLDMFGIAIFGFISSILTAVIIVAISNMTGFNLFTLNIWVVIPVGAILVGFVASSGYYFGSLFFHKRANVFLFIQMIVIAGFTQVLIYYMQYTTLVLDNGIRASEVITFGKYMDVSLTSAHYVSRRVKDMGEVGSFGYWLAVFQFIGFLFGGLSAFGFLVSKPVCRKCNNYLRTLSKLRKTFSEQKSASKYYDMLFHYPVDSQEFENLLKSKEKSKVEKGSISITTTLLSCPKCKEQHIQDKVKIFNGSDWKDIEKLDRIVAIPNSIDLIKVFKI